MTVPILTIPQYAEQVGKTEKTIRNWIRDGQLPDAVKNPSGPGYLIPATAMRSVLTVATTGGTGTASRAAAAPTIEAILATLPGLVDLDTAARLLGCTVGHIVANRDRYEVETGGASNGQGFLMPQRVIRRVFGLIP